MYFFIQLHAHIFMTLGLITLSHTQCKRALKAQQFGTWFVGVLGHPGNCDASDLRVAESQQEGTVGFGQQHVLCLLLVYKAQDGPTHTYVFTHKNSVPVHLPCLSLTTCTV